MQGAGFRVQGSGYILLRSREALGGEGVRGRGGEQLDSGFRVPGSGCRVHGSGCRVQGAGCRVQGSGFRVQGPAAHHRLEVERREDRLEVRERQVQLPGCVGFHIQILVIYKLGFNQSYYTFT